MDARGSRNGGLINVPSGAARHDTDQEPPALEVRDLVVTVSTRRGEANAVDGISLTVNESETVALVGESGSGKSMTALAAIGLTPKPAARITRGEIMLKGRPLTSLSDREWSDIRGNEIGMILQDPLTALNPVLAIGEQVGEGIERHMGLRGAELRTRIIELLDAVRIPDPASRLRAYPHQFSGGMRQRVVGAIALGCDPSVLIADEPTTSLDVTVERAFLRLLDELRESTGVGVLFITHDFGIVGRISHRVAVMYAGRIVEFGPTREVLTAPKHPYTEALIASVPDISKKPPKRLPSIQGRPLALYEPRPACAFAPRCPYVMDKCWTTPPPKNTADPDHSVHCWRHE